MPEFLERLVWFKSAKKTYEVSMHYTLNILRFPSFQSPLVLPADLRNKFKGDLEKFLSSNMKYLEEIEVNHTQRLIDYLDVVKTPHAGAATQEKLQKDFKTFYSQYDKRRGKDFEKTFPIIGEWLSWHMSMGLKSLRKLKIKDMTPKQKELLIESESFCMLPWMHLHAYPDGRAYPCCFAFDPYPVGDLNKQSLKEVFNSEKMKEMRLKMLNNKKSRECIKCYDQEKSGFFSLRLSSNKHFGHNIGLVDSTQPDGTADFVIKYWDIRFSNLCNMACRSCGTWFSSNWYEDHKKLTGAPPPHAKIMKVGRSTNDMWEQMLESFDYAEQFYFAGGEPLIMEEHYRILKELDKRKMYHVRLIYNSNFSRLKFKDMDVLELWNKFDSVSVGASLDAEGSRGELMRKGTVWKDIVANRKKNDRSLS